MITTCDDQVLPRRSVMRTVHLVPRLIVPSNGELPFGMPIVSCCWCGADYVVRTDASDCDDECFVTNCPRCGKPNRG